MSYTISYFETLRSRFPTWPELKAHFESQGLRVVENPDTSMVVVRYTKSSSETGLLRSVVWDTESNTPLSVAPPAAQEGEPPDVQLSATEDFADGVMVNAFVGADGSLYLATRTTLGANNHFYSATSFSEMFSEALQNSSLQNIETLEKIMNDARVSQNATSCFVSFVIQHPEHRVVVKTDVPTMFVIHVGYVTDTGSVTVCERATNWPHEFGRFQVHSYATRRFKDGEARQMLQRTAVQRGWRWQGLVFKDGTGRRWRMRSTTYQMLRTLRGNEATPVDRFLRLRKEKKVVEYLKHYSEERDVFWQFETTLRARTEDVMSAYIDVHKAHSVAFKDLDPAYKPAVFLLHKMWLGELREKGFVIRSNEAIRVVADMQEYEQKRLMSAAPYVAAVPAVPAVAAPIDLDVAAC